MPDSKGQGRHNIAFIDVEVDALNKQIIDTGCVTWDGSDFHSGSVAGLLSFIKNRGRTLS